MGITRNYQLSESGTLVASGAGNATVTISDRTTKWEINESAVATQALQVRHNIADGTISLALASGEYLWLFGDEIAAVTADNGASGYIGE